MAVPDLVTTRLPTLRLAPTRVANWSSYQTPNHSVAPDDTPPVNPIVSLTVTTRAQNAPAFVCPDTVGQKDSSVNVRPIASPTAMTITRSVLEIVCRDVFVDPDSYDIAVLMAGADELD
ncbi:unnamed protein product [Medioppia subpectinata]|uniref:Uncharacterized protein n=1 Tax=Medioppia subpectinata TaxID=1979941 RepID=A0A7R9KYS2_9ACAR|nr:unnamed protein product [Medioppia subpectinata]CAG2111090.1 unnamed protein product [Medioppia subpectinata]